jgi:O-antigen/teichoic acid export membrane protein
MTHSMQAPSTTQSGTLKAEAQSYIALMRDLIKHSGIYALSSLASPLIALVLAPFLTHSLSPTDYGALTVLNTAIILITGITQLGMISAVFRAYNYDYESQQDRLKVLSTTVILLSLTSFPLMLIFIFVAPWLANLMLGSASFSNAIRITSLVVLIQNFAVPGLAWLRAESRAMFFSILSIINLLIALIANIFLVGVVHMGIIGSLLATGAGYAIIVICTLPAILLRAGVSSRLDVVQNLVSFGVPLVFNSISFWVLQLSDRYLLSRLGSLAQTASYGVAYSLGGALNVVVLAPFTLAWPTAMFAIAHREDAAHVFRLVFRWFGLAVLLIAFVLALIATIMLNTLFPPSYHPAAPIIPIVSLSIVLYGIYTIFTVGTGVHRKTWFVALVMTLAALINVAANLVLIPLCGSLGAALSTLIAYILLTVMMYIVNQRIYPLPFETGLFLVALLLGIAIYTGADVLAQNQAVYAIYAIYISSIVLYAICIITLEKLAEQRDKRHERKKQAIK